MDCDRADLVIGLLEEELDPAEKAEVEAHLQGCVACRATRDAYAATLGELRALPAERPSADAAARAYAAVVEAMGAQAAASRSATPAAGELLAFPAPRSRRTLVVQLAAAAASLLLVVSLLAPDRDAREQARATPAGAPAAATAPSAAPAPAAARAAKSAPAGWLGLEDGVRKDQGPGADRAEGGEALAFDSSVAGRERSEAALKREEARDAAGARRGADDLARPVQTRPTAPTRPPAVSPPAAPTASPPAPPQPRGGGGAPSGGRANQGSAEPLGEPDGASPADAQPSEARRRAQGAPATPPRAPAPAEAERTSTDEAPASDLAATRGDARAAAALGAWRVTLDGETADVALVAESADGLPRLLVVTHEAPSATGATGGAAPSSANGAAPGGAAQADDVRLLDGAASSPDLVRALEAGDDDKADRDPDALKSRRGVAPQDARGRRVLLAILAHEVGADATASRAEAVVIARAERVAALLAALDGRPLDPSLSSDRASRRQLLRLARERVERDVPAPARSAR